MNFQGVCSPIQELYFFLCIWITIFQGEEIGGDADQSQAWTSAKKIR